MSPLCTSCISDIQLIEQPGFLNLLPKGNRIIADCWFMIADLLVPLGKQDQLEGSKVVETQRIASLRIHIKQVIHCVKEFDMFYLM